jgi:hypothetical protein
LKSTWNKNITANLSQNRHVTYGQSHNIEYLLLTKWFMQIVLRFFFHFLIWHWTSAFDLSQGNLNIQHHTVPYDVEHFVPWYTTIPIWK